jgi:hypothetical protein
MEEKISPAAQVRREFRLGRPPRTLAEHEQLEPLHPTVVWRRANEAVSSFRARMTAAKLNPRHVAAAIVYVEQAQSDQPRFLPLEEKGKSPEDVQSTAFEALSRSDVIALGMIFVQLDEQIQKKITFPHLFFPLNKRGMDVLKKAAALEFDVLERLKTAN